MTSAHIIHLVSDYLDGKLSAGEANRVRSHTIFCNACRRVLDETKLNLDILKSIPSFDPPAGLEGKILARLRQEKREGSPKLRSPETAVTTRTGSWFKPYYGLVFASLVVLIVVVVREQHRNPSEIMMAPSQADHTSRSSVPSEILLEKPLSTNRDEEKHEMKKESDAFMSRAKIANQAVPRSLSQDNVNSPSLGQKQAVPMETGALKEKQDTFGQQIMTAKSATQHLRSASAVSPAPTAGLEILISDTKTWHTIWSQYHDPQKGGQAAPSVDFAKHQVVAVGTSIPASQNLTVEITKVEDTEWEGKPARIVYYRLPRLERNSASAPEPAFGFLVIPLSKGPVFFKKIP